MRGGAIFLVTASMLVLTACGGSSTVQDRDPNAGRTDKTRPETTGAAAGRKEPSDHTGRLAGTTWSLAELEGRELIKGTAITLNFRRGGLGGNAGCNSYNANKAKIGEETIELSTISTTEMACGKAGGGGVMSQEQRYLRALGGAATYQLRGDLLEIRNDEGEKTLLFQKETG